MILDVPLLRTLKSGMSAHTAVLAAITSCVGVLP